MKFSNIIFFIFIYVIATKSVVCQNSCPTPAQSYYISDAEGVKVFWSPSSPTATYTLEYRDDSSIQWNQVETTDTFTYIPLDTICAVFDYRIRPRCDNVPGAFSQPAKFLSQCGSCNTNAYCNFDQVENDFEWIESVSVDGVKYISGKDRNGVGNHLGLTDFQATQGDTIDITIAPQFLANDVNQEFYSIWIDYNHNGLFEDSENIVSIDSFVTSELQILATVPNTAFIGITRMRVMLAFNKRPRSCDFNDFVFGEVEDYCIQILEPVSPCDVNLDLELVSKSEDRLSLSWRNNENAIAYDIRYRSESTDWSTEISFSNRLDLIDLDTCTSYEIQNRLICGSDTSSYSNSQFFETLCSTSILSISDIAITIYPNPFSSHIIITNSLDRNLEANFYNSSGVLLFSENINAKSVIGMKQLNALPAGVYLMNVSDGQATMTKKLMKL